MERKHWLALISGILWLAAFGLLNLSATGFQATYGPRFGELNRGELHLWVAWTLMALPASFLIAWALVPKLKKPVTALSTIEEFDSVEERKLLFATTLFIAAFYRILRAIFLLDLPITDEEYSLSFGGHILASGNLTVPLNVPPDFFPTLFLFQTPDGTVTSFDHIGPQLAWVFSHVTGSGPWIFALVAATTFVGFWAALRADMSRGWALAGTGILFASPAMLGLSLTTHTHVLSRAFIALFLGAYAWARRNGSMRLWALTGAFWGASMITRPTETFLLTVPLLLMTAWDERSDGILKKIGIFCLASAPFAILEMARNMAIVGSPLPLRLMNNPYPSSFPAPTFTAFLHDWNIFLNRLIHNISHNFELLHVWFLGIPGVVLVVLGLTRTATNRRLVVGSLAILAFGITHDNFGIYLAGPIHQSELIIPLALFATYGLRAVWNVLDRHELFAPEKRAAFIGFGLALSFTIFNVQNLTSIRKSQSLHENLYTFIDTAELPPQSVVLVPPLVMFWHDDKTAARSWVFELRAPSPDLSDTPLVLRFRPGAAEWAVKTYPDRPLFVVMPGTPHGTFELHDLRQQDPPAQ